jgi:nitrogen fixation protein FixH
MQVSNEHNGQSGSAWRSPWVIGWIGLVAVVLGVNLTMVWLAFSTSPGLVNDDYYERGQDYEKHLASRLAKDPGWTMRADIPPDLRPGSPATVRIVMVDKTGQPVSPDRVTFYAYRPSDKRLDFESAMTQEGAGRYAARVSFPLFGRWDWLIAVRQGEDEYTLGDELTVAKP